MIRLKLRWWNYRLTYWRQYCIAWVRNSWVSLASSSSVNIGREERYCYMAHVYNMRLVYDWHKWHGLPSLLGLDAERSQLVAQIEILPIPQELLPHLMWEPYLT